MAEVLAEIPGPYEIFELADTETKTLEIQKWEIGTMKIITPEFPEGKIIKVLRVWVPRAIKPIGTDYYDITSQTLIAQLEPYLKTPDFRRKKFIITKFGVAPRARFKLEVK